jgi:hypothetical protein
MNISDAIYLVDKLKPNQYSTDIKTGWLSKLDGQIFKEVFLTHADSPIESFEGYDGSDPEQELLVPYPYDEDIYNYFLQAQIDKENGETAKYNQSITLYNNAFHAFQAWYNRTHLPIPTGQRFLF